MPDEQDPTTELDAILADAFDLRLDDVQMARFEQLLSESQAIDYYVDHAILHAMLRWEHTQPQDDVTGDPWLQPLPAAAIEQPTKLDISPSPVLHINHGTMGYLSSGWPVAYLIATVIFAIGALVGSVIYVSQPVQIAQQSVPLPSPLSPLHSASSVVGRITGMADCKWNGMAAKSRNVALGNKYELASGLMEIIYDTGAKVILQGPVSYTVDSKDGGFLSVGKLTARVEKSTEYGVRSTEKVAGGQWSVADKSEIINMKSEMAASPPSALRLPPSSSSPLSTLHSPLFTIKTPTAIVTDLGTEFGVDVDQTGNTTSHVFRGFVKVQAVADGDTLQGDGQLLYENQSVRVEKGDKSVTIKSVSSIKPEDFVRAIPETHTTVKIFDLVDAVSGGDGYSGGRSGKIDPTNGKCIPAPDAEHLYVPGPQDRILTGDGKYHRVPERPFVDGVFIPNGEHGPVQVDSAGHTCDSFLATRNTSGGCMTAGGILYLAPPQNGLKYIPTVLNGVDYSESPHGVIFMHSNQGITFDLDAIRQANADNKIVQFTSVAGNGSPERLLFDVSVLIDGKVRFKRREINREFGALSINIPIHQQDRFLTLAATDGGNGIECDWVFFGDPQLKLIPERSGERRAGGK